MEMIQTEKLVYEYEKRDEEGNVIGTSRAIDEVDIEANRRFRMGEWKEYE